MTRDQAKVAFNSSHNIKDVIDEIYDSLEKDDYLNLNSKDKLRLALESVLDVSISNCSMNLILEYIYSYILTNKEN